MCTMEGKVSVESFDSICRACLSCVPSSALRPLTDVRIRDVYSNFTRLEVAETDNLPQNICSQCITKCEDGKTFLNMCESNEIFLLALLSSAETESGEGSSELNESNEEIEADHMDRIVKEEPDDCDFGHSSKEEIEYDLNEATRDQEEDDIDMDEEDGDGMNEEDDMEDKASGLSSGLKGRIDKLNGWLIDLEATITCQLCGDVFKEIAPFERHMSKYPTNTEFKCKKCGRSYVNKSCFKDHMYKHSGFRFGCEICDRVMQTPSMARWHHNMCSERKKVAEASTQNSTVPVNSEATIKCQFCGAIFDKIILFEAHQKEHVSEIKFECTDCNSKYTTKTRFKNHMYRHSGFTFPCDKCDEVFQTPSLRINHRQKCIGEDAAGIGRRTKKEVKGVPVDPDNTTIVCQLCDKSFPDVDSFENHFVEHQAWYQKFNCKECGKELANLSKMKDHMYLHSGYIFPCSMCNKEFRAPSNSKRHQDSCRSFLAAPYKKFVCDICGYGCARESYWEKHKLRHSTERPYPCTICSNAFKTELALTMHMKRHTEKNSVSCDKCSKTFNTAADMRDHRNRMHTEVRRFQCDICPKGFIKKCFLVDHIRAHMGERPYPCDLCTEKFAKNHLLTKHKSLVHKIGKRFDCSTCPKSFNIISAYRTHQKRCNKKYRK